MPGTRRGFGVLVLAVAVFLTALVAVPALAEDGTAGLPLPPPAPAGSDGSQTNTGSVDGYANATQQEAENLFTDDFAGTVNSLASDPPDLSGEHPAFVDNHTAIIGSQGGPTPSQIESTLRQDQHDIAAARSDLEQLLSQQTDQGPSSPELVSSALPLRTGEGDGQAPVDLSLDRQGSDYVPQNPLVDLKLPEDLSNDVAVGDQGLKVDVGATGSSTADPIAGNNLFYANAAPATDVVLAPISSGLESFYELRAPESPDHFQMNFTLPQGAQLEDTGDGGATIEQDGQTVGAVYPPAATDAAGNPVGVSMSVSDDSLEFNVPHSDPGIRYPISVDPVVDLYTWSTDGGGQFADWVANKTTGSPYQLKTTCTQNVSCTSGTTGPTGLYVQVPPSSGVTNPSSGSWQYSVPHYPWTTAYISTLNLGPMYFARRGDTGGNPFMFAGIYSGSSSSYVTSQSQPTDAGNVFWSLDPGSDTSGKQANFSLMSLANRTTANVWRDAYLGGAAIWVGDGESPELTDVTHTGINVGQDDWSYSNWVDDATPSVSVTAQDNGVGIKSLTLPDDAGLVDNIISENCDGTSASPCPQHPDPVSASYDTGAMPDGATITGLVATDALDKSSARIFVVRVDHTAPDIDTSGSLTQPSGIGPYTLHVNATDGDASDPSGASWQSGVKSVDISVNGQSVANTGDHACTTEAASCPLSLDYTVNPSDFSTNQLHIRVTATDELGHTHTTEWDTAITGANTGPTITLSGPAFNSPAGWLYQPQTYQLSAAAQDSSGATELDFLVDGQQVDQASQSCSGGGCSLSHTFSLTTSAFSGGAHTVMIRATDAAGNTATDSWTTNIDPSGTVSGNEAASTISDAAPGALDPSAPATIGSDTVIDPHLVSTGGGYDAAGVLGSATVSSQLSGGFTLEDTIDGTPPISFAPATTGSNITGGSSLAAPPSGSSNSTAVVYGNSKGSGADTALRPTAAGMDALTELRDSSAPTSYSWQVNVPQGDSLVQVGNDEAAVVSQPLADDADAGGTQTQVPPAGAITRSSADDVSPSGPEQAVPDAVTQLDSAGNSLEDADQTTGMDAEATITASWARDATGASVPTSLSVSGNTITQTVDSASGNYQYPVVDKTQFYQGSGRHCHAYVAKPEWNEQGNDIHLHGHGGIQCSYRHYQPTEHSRVTLTGYMIRHPNYNKVSHETCIATNHCENVFDKYEYNYACDDNTYMTVKMHSVASGDYINRKGHTIGIKHIGSPNTVAVQDCGSDKAPELIPDPGG